MPRTGEQIAAATLGELMMQIIKLRADLELAQAKIADLSTPTSPSTSGG